MRVRLELRLKPVLAAHQAEVAIAAKGNIERKFYFGSRTAKEKKEPSSDQKWTFSAEVRRLKSVVS